MTENNNNNEPTAEFYASAFITCIKQRRPVAEIMQMIRELSPDLQAEVAELLEQTAERYSK